MNYDVVNSNLFKFLRLYCIFCFRVLKSSFIRWYLVIGLKKMTMVSFELLQFYLVIDLFIHCRGQRIVNC